MITKWVHDPASEQPYICWMVDDSSVLIADPFLVPELIASVSLLLGEIKNGIVQDEGLVEDVKRLLWEMHGQYREEEG